MFKSLMKGLMAVGAITYFSGPVKAWVGGSISTTHTFGTCLVDVAVDPTGYSHIRIGSSAQIASSPPLQGEFVGGANHGPTGYGYIAVNSFFNNLLVRDIEACGFSSVSDFQANPFYSTYSLTEEVSFAFRGVPAHGAVVQTTTGSVTGDGATAYDFRFALTGAASAAPSYESSATVVAPEIFVTSSDVTVNGGVIVDGGSAQIDSATAGTPIALTVRVHSEGLETLTIGQPGNGGATPANVGAVVYGPPGSLSLAPDTYTDFSVLFTPTAAGAFTVPVTFVTNDSDENPFNFEITGYAALPPQSDIVITSSESGAVADNGTDTVSSAVDVGTPQTVTYQISNAGTIPLVLTPPSIETNISYTSNVTVDSLTLNSTSVAPNSSTTMVIGYTATAGGAFEFDWFLQSNDPDLATFNITVSGVTADTPETEFEKTLEEIIDTVQADARRELLNEVSANQDMMGGALDRFLDRRTGNGVTRNTPFDVTGSLSVTDEAATAQGTFGGSDVTGSGASRFLFGDFNLSRDQDGSTTGQLSARVIWERELINDTTVGYFLGGRASRSNLAGGFEGDASTLGVLAGVYGIKELTDNIFGSAYVGAGYSWTDMQIASPTLALDGDYEGKSYYAGFQVTGVIEPAPKMEVRPELKVDYGYTDIGVVGFDATGFNTSSAVSADFGSISLLETAFRTEVLWFMGDGDRTTLSLAPSINCRKETGQSSSSDCGGGVELGIANQSVDGMTQLNANYAFTKVGNIEQQSITLSLEMQF